MKDLPGYERPLRKHISVSFPVYKYLFNLQEKKRCQTMDDLMRKIIKEMIQLKKEKREREENQNVYEK